MATRRVLLFAAGGPGKLVIAHVLETLSCGVARAQRLESGVRHLGIGGSTKIPGISPGRNEPPTGCPWTQSFLHVRVTCHRGPLPDRRGRRRLQDLPRLAVAL